jgi:hypothetical protein
MKIYMIALIAVFCFSAFMVSDNKHVSFKKLYKLEGTWKMNTKRGAICEEWKR